jgi:hypothetical protein
MLWRHRTVLIKMADVDMEKDGHDEVEEDKVEEDQEEEDE